MSGLTSPKSKAADLLLRAQVLPRHRYDHVMTIVRDTNERAEEVIVDQDVMSEADLLKHLSGVYRTNFVSSERLAKADIPRATVQMVPRRVAETLGVFPVLFDPNTFVLSVVTPDPDNAELLREVKLVSGAKDVKAFVARPAAVAAAIRKHHLGDAHAFDALTRPLMAFERTQSITPAGRGAARDSLKLGDLGSLAPGPSAPPAARGSWTNEAGAPKGTTSRQAPPPPANRPFQSTPQPNRPPPVPQRAAQNTGPVAPRPPSSPSLDPSIDGGRRPQPSLTLSLTPPPMQVPDNIPLRPGLPGAPSSAPGTSPPSSEFGRQQILSHDTTIELLTVMVSLLENTRQDLRGHSSQVARLLKRVAERMNLDRQETYAVVVAGHIHDIGKMGQFHLTALNCAEYESHRTAAQKAYDTPLRLLEAVRLPASIRNAVFHMYERFDGTGFPDKLVGKEIPLGARLLAVADTYADLTQNPRNPYRKVLGPSEAMNVLLQHKGTIFDPGILDLFKSLVLGEDMKAKLLADRYHALIIDADPEESTVLELRMVEQGFDVKTARSIDVARKLMSAEGADFDLVVSEVELPDADGLAFLSEARKEPWGREVVWVIHTSKQGRTEAQRAFELGAKDFVAKPVQADVLVAKLKALLDQWLRAHADKSIAKGVAGSLREMGLPDIVQILFHGRKTGKLAVRSNGKMGEIHFLEGAIADASFESLRGADAFYQMVKFVDGDFALDPSFAPPERKIQESTEGLLLEGMRRMDEGL